MPGFLQRAGAVIALAVLCPFLVALACAVRLTSPGSAFHRALRVSRGRPFTLYKFRTMRSGVGTENLGVTACGDPRITRLGRILRRTKLDELPQLWNVVRGEMLLVGPRPEDPRYIDWDDPSHRLVFGAAPGITGPTAIAFREEERLLAEEAGSLARAGGRNVVTAADVERAYRERILPLKLAMDADYLRDRSFRGDLAILGRTVSALAAGTTKPR